MNRFHRCTLIGLSSIAAFPVGASDFARNYLEQAFATSIVLTDSDVFTVGIHDFDPNDWFNLKNEQIGSDQSVQRRQEMAITTIPYTFELSEPSANNQQRVFTRFSVVRSRQDFSIFSNEAKDHNDEYILGGYAAYQYQFSLNEQWSVTPSIGVHLQYFKNHHDYRSDLSQAIIKPIFDGVLFNTDAWALSYEPSVEAKYTHVKDWGSWNFSSSFHYFYGMGWGKANGGDVGNPEGWYMGNGLEAYYNVNHWGKSLQSLYTSIRRIDIGGDTSDPLGTEHYYEGSVGWLMTPPFKSNLIDNIGIGLNINYGSALKGGSIVFFFNQTD
ncbi:hypothetical protein VISI1226_01740 [Vibrio sinaloensis DSM 21326]|uniref:Solitary outer membrane autotransporter-like beta-barrel domain-containing protein n=1 Tax=Vibrio sinaloensis DSM 21326 TaxID=945550 RepID=E8M5L4_PHOS4|nr:Solitary outer membrane autotransporter beta-barrel domain [Vibrio sinaloensis]EGA70807.1 hypothetical protein VISI1226_01740 [Vibrio sinaloensis DSM 21326]